METVKLQLKEQSYTLKESLRALKTNIQFCGDDKKVIEEGIKYFLDKECDIGVMPCHPENGHFDILVPVYGEIITVFPKGKASVVKEERYFENISVATKLYQEVISSL